MKTSGPLAGATLGVKDIILTRDFPTRFGSPFLENKGPLEDAWCVALARRQGAIVVGKTVSTEFAFARPGPTRNPHDLTRTPGGSSSGSAAAVAAGFVSFAFGTQTGGSVIRPASYCGIVGYKPSYGLLPTDGIQPASTTLDHLGIFARSPRDTWLLAASLLGEPPCVAAHRPGRVLILDLPSEIPLADILGCHLDRLRRELAMRSVGVGVQPLPFPVEDFAHLQETICYWEASRLLLRPGRLRLTDGLIALLEPYLSLDGTTYMAARERRQRYQSDFATLVAEYDAILMASAPGIAPSSLSHTGDAILNRFWTALHVPAVSVPIWHSPQGLPLGLQLLGRLGSDHDLLSLAQWFHEQDWMEGKTCPSPR
jgi:Asp-tRNA(Asn)/Glu-tRNA(Gln) amidotransferase A subunit family amidase